MHKLLWDFEMQTDHLISARQPDLEMIFKRERICRIVEFDVSAGHGVKLKENEMYLDFARELKKKTVEHESDGYSNRNWCTW